MPIILKDYTQLSDRTIGALSDAGIHTLSDLRDQYDRVIALEIKNLGSAGLYELREAGLLWHAAK